MLSRKLEQITLMMEKDLWITIVVLGICGEAIILISTTYLGPKLLRT